MNDERMQITCCYWPMNENARSLKLKLITTTAFLLVINDSFPQSIHKKQYRTHVKRILAYAYVDVLDSIRTSHLVHF